MLHIVCSASINITLEIVALKKLVVTVIVNMIHGMVVKAIDNKIAI